MPRIQVSVKTAQDIVRALIKEGLDEAEDVMVQALLVPARGQLVALATDIEEDDACLGRLVLEVEDIQIIGWPDSAPDMIGIAVEVSGTGPDCEYDGGLPLNPCLLRPVRLVADGRVGVATGPAYPGLREPASAGGTVPA